MGGYDNRSRKKQIVMDMGCHFLGKSFPPHSKKAIFSMPTAQQDSNKESEVETFKLQR